MPEIKDRRALDELFSLAYEELRRVASSALRRDRAAPITPTTLVNEAWLKLAHSPQVKAADAIHFRHIAGRAMRQILVDAARRRRSVIHGGDLLRITFDGSLGVAPLAIGRDLLALDEALERLASIAPRQAQLVEARFFGGFDCAECAEMFQISEATIMRDWRSARAWLAHEISVALKVPEQTVPQS